MAGESFQQLGQATMAKSVSVTIASDQGAIPTTTSSGAPDITTTGAIAGNTSVTLALSGQASVTVQILTTGLTGTLNFEASDDGGTTYFPTALWPVGQTASGNLVTSVTNPSANALYEGNVSADSHFRVRGSGVTAGTATITIRAGLSTSAVVLDGPIPAGQNLIGSTRLQDGVGAFLATVAAFHNADNQQPGSTAYGLLTGGVAQLLNASGNLDRQRETGQDGIPSQGIATGTAQLAEPFSTTSATAVSAPFTSAKVITPAAMSGTNRGAAWSIQVGSVLLCDTGASVEAVVVTAVTATTFTALFSKAHSGTWAIAGFVYNQARDATTADGSTGAGFAAGATYLLNAALNTGAGGWEGERSAAGELDGASGTGTAVAAEYEYNSGGPVLASGLPSGLGFDRGRNVQGKSTSLGAGLGATPVAFGSTVRLRWTFGGTVAPTSVTFSASIIGK